MKRLTSTIIAVVMLISCCTFAHASNISAPRASDYISDYNVALKAGTNRGEIRINYDVSATKAATSLGVSEIKIYKSTGAYVTTITGSTTNGLIRSNASSHMSVYSYTGSSGTSYYAEVTIFVTCSTGSDSRTITTAVVKAS